MTPDPRATALMSFGYTPNQAAFLALVALHGGYFLRRQYATFLDCQDGAVVQDLVDRLLRRHHATRATYCRDTHVHRLSARPLFEALGIGNSRNRRSVPAAAITFKLMTVDVVLRHRDATFLPTEAEKVAYFTTTCGLSTEVLPATCYRSTTPGRAPTTRYFVDKAPIYLTPPSPQVTVVYLQGWSDTLVGLEAFLAQYRPLLTALAHPRVGFATTNPTLTTAVTAQWSRLWEKITPPVPHVDVPRAELLTHFQARRRMENRDWQGFEPPDLDRLRNDLARFNAPAIHALYRCWCAGGDSALDQLDAVDPQTPPTPPLLETDLLPFRYPLFPTAGGSS